jgi:signal transduction histidine kinase/integral membrane sensor domain MASE1
VSPHADPAVSAPRTHPRTALPVRLLAFATATVAAGAVGRLSHDDELTVSLVWPLYGVAVLWLATGDRRTWPWDVAALAVATGASLLLNDGTPAEAAAAALLAVVAGATWLAVVRRLAPDLWGGGGQRRMSRLPDLVAVLAASAVTAALVAVLRGTGLGLLPPLDPDQVWLTAVRNLSWILGLGALGLLALPADAWEALRSWFAREWADRPAWRALETVGVVLTTTLLTSAAFGPEPTPFAFSLVLCTVWAAFRLPAPVAVLFAFVLGSVAVVSTLTGQGVFVAEADPFTRAAIAQGFLITQVLAALAICLGAEERRAATARAEEAEREATTRALLLGTVLENVDEAILAVRADGRHDLRNRPARTLLGSATGRDVIGGDRVLADARGDALPPGRSPFTRALEGDDVIAEDHRVRRPDHPDVLVRVSAVRVDPGHGEPVVVSTFRDVTREHEERDQLVSFAGVVAHDLQNPLTVVRGWTEALREELAEEECDVPVLRSMLERVQGASDQMHHFIDDLLAFTVARDRPLDIADVDLSAVAEEVAELRRVGETRPRITVQEGMKVRADRPLVRQLLDNLIGNSVKYVAPGVRPHVAVTAVERDEELEISVTDNGIGIPSAMRQRVFDSFARAHDVDYSGTGLGLAICERAVTRHGGRIWVDAAPDEGTRISFTLPMS